MYAPTLSVWVNRLTYPFTIFSDPLPSAAITRVTGWATMAVKSTFVSSLTSARSYSKRRPRASVPEKRVTKNGPTPSGATKDIFLSFRKGEADMTYPVILRERGAEADYNHVGRLATGRGPAGKRRSK